MPTNKAEIGTIRKIRLLIAFFIFGLVLSGATAIPLQTEMDALLPMVRHLAFAKTIGLTPWLDKIQIALIDSNSKYPFLAYGTDWLAFGHFAIALAFVGPWRDPVRNIWVIDYGMIACVLVVPYALAMGELRGIPLPWRCIDCSFGVVGIVPLLICRQEILKLERARSNGAR